MTGESLTTGDGSSSVHNGACFAISAVMAGSSPVRNLARGWSLTTLTMSPKRCLIGCGRPSPEPVDETGSATMREAGAPPHELMPGGLCSWHALTGDCSGLACPKGKDNGGADGTGSDGGGSAASVNVAWSTPSLAGDGLGRAPTLSVQETGTALLVMSGICVPSDVLTRMA